MAKPIYVTNDDVENICSELKNTLNGLKCYGNVDIKRSFKSDNRSAILYFTPLAWIKMIALVSRFETEVQWHGMARRISENEFEIYDIIVHPHEVSGTTVTSEYETSIEWRDSLDDDTFNSIRFHGHSHVNMSVSPSAVDNKYRRDLVTQFPIPIDDDDVFYIFLIINKKHEWSAEIYDLTNNALYGTDEIRISVEMVDIDSFIAEAKKTAVARTDYRMYAQKKNSSVTQSHKSAKKNTKNNSNCRGRDSLEGYYEAVYGTGWDDNDDMAYIPFNEEEC